MVEEKVWIVINISLGFLAVLLFVNLLGVEMPNLGKAMWLLDREEPFCVVVWNEEGTEWNNIDSCCVEVRKQLECSREEKIFNGKRTDRVCQTGSGRVLQYWLNNKAYNYCRQLSIWG